MNLSIWRGLLGLAGYADRWLAEQYVSEEWVQKWWAREGRRLARGDEKKEKAYTRVVGQC